MFNGKVNELLKSYGFVPGQAGCYLLYEKEKRKIKASIVPNEKTGEIVMTIYNSLGNPHIFRLPGEDVITNELLNDFF
jgi:hypothetical protein